MPLEMPAPERTLFALHSKTRSFQRKIEWTQQIIANALRETNGWYSAFSGGVDSTVLLDLLFQAGYRFPVLWGDDGIDFPETLAFLSATEARYRFSLYRVRSMAPWQSWCEEMGRPDLRDDPAAREAWGNPHVWDATWHTLTKDAPTHGYRGVFLGMLACESADRRRQLRNGTRPLYQIGSPGHMWHCSPLASWTKRDVWSYVVSRNLPYNPVYDLLATLDVPIEQRRVAPITCFRVMQYGSHARLKQAWPDLWNHVTAHFPDVRAYG